MAKFKINFKTDWLPNDDGLLNTCNCCEETIYANANELCMVGDGIETRWLGVFVCGSCKEVLTTPIKGDR